MLLRDALAEEGFGTVAELSRHAARSAAASRDIDLVILDEENRAIEGALVARTSRTRGAGALGIAAGFVSGAVYVARGFRRWRLWSFLRRYSAGLAVMIVAIAVTTALNEVTPQVPSAIVFAAIIVIAWIAGFSAAIVAAVVASGTVLYLRHPHGSWRVTGADVVWIAGFLASAAMMAWLIARVRYLDRQRNLSLAREREARAQAEAANAAKDGFLAIVSHEMKTPLTAILGWAEVLRRGDPLADRTRAAETIARNARLQSTLIDDLLDISRAGAGKLDISPTSIDAADVVRHVVRSHEPRAHDVSIKLVGVIEPDVSVFADRQRLEQVVSNLLVNAFKFTPAGGRIRVCLERHETVARLIVADSGRGIEASELERVFERFWQGTRVGRPAGLGLGLAIVRHIVSAHGGRVWAESPGPGLGATFIVELPLADPERQPHRARRAPRET